MGAGSSSFPLWSHTVLLEHLVLLHCGYLNKEVGWHSGKTNLHNQAPGLDP